MPGSAIASTLRRVAAGLRILNKSLGPQHTLTREERDECLRLVRECTTTLRRLSEKV
jgi:hypothetical protein